MQIILTNQEASQSPRGSARLLKGPPFCVCTAELVRSGREQKGGMVILLVIQPTLTYRYSELSVNSYIFKFHFFLAILQPI